MTTTREPSTSNRYDRGRELAAPLFRGVRGDVTPGLNVDVPGRFVGQRDRA